MSDNTRIEWTDATWNPITGCSVLSPGCTNCYAMNLAGTRLRHHPSRSGLTLDTKAGPVWTGSVRLNEAWLTQPLKWKRPRNIFVCAHGDLFHENVPDEWIDKIFAVMALAPHHTFQVLTKRSGRMLRYLQRNDVSLLAKWARAFAPATFIMTQHEIEAHISPFASTDHRALYHATMPVIPLPNVLLGASVEDQDRADQHRDNLGPLARRDGWRTFASYEPALGPVDWTGWEFLCWMISGGESGAGARPSHPDWHRNARDFCAREGIPFFFKQWGEWLPFGQSGFTAWWAVTSRKGEIRRVKDKWWGRAYFNDGAGGPNTKFIEPVETLIVGNHGQQVVRVGKKAAGRLLDGVEHNEMPTP